LAETALASWLQEYDQQKTDTKENDNRKKNAGPTVSPKRTLATVAG
jgi:hypothetical protein